MSKETFPSKIDFEQLIFHCEIDRFVEPELHIDDLENGIKNSVKLLLAARKKAANEEFVKLPAYQWIFKTNGIAFNRAIKNLNLSDSHTDVDFDVIFKKYQDKIKKKALPHLSLDRARTELIHLAKKAQEFESLLAYISKCFINFLYPPLVLTPKEYKETLRTTIKRLEALQKDFNKLQGYNDIFFNYTVSNQNRFIEYHIETLKSIEELYLFPSKKINEQYEMRMFIISVLRYFLVNNKLTKENFKHILGFIMELITFDCFDNPITEVNVRKIVNDEIDRKARSERIQKKKHYITGNKHGLEQGLDMLLAYSSLNFFE